MDAFGTSKKGNNGIFSGYNFFNITYFLSRYVMLVTPDNCFLKGGWTTKTSRIWKRGVRTPRRTLFLAHIYLSDISFVICFERRCWSWKLDSGGDVFLFLFLLHRILPCSLHSNSKRKKSRGEKYPKYRERRVEEGNTAQYPIYLRDSKAEELRYHIIQYLYSTHQHFCFFCV